ncbi:MAG: hypothetical protein JWR58_5498 [Pseudonocardia sp.]|jgi:hypothetical protein|nr:hypothetical protein [Pseudonocardia sp.]
MTPVRAAAPVPIEDPQSDTTRLERTFCDSAKVGVPSGNTPES